MTKIRAPRVVLRSMVRMRNARNSVLDIKYAGESLGGEIDPVSKGSTETQSVDYGVLKKLSRWMNIARDDVLVDVGCGKGRVIHWWLGHGLRNKIYGVELNSEVAKDTQNRCARHENVTIIEGDVLENMPADATVFFLYNPFHHEVMRAFKSKIEEVYRGRHDVRIIYYANFYVDEFEGHPAWEFTTRRVVIPHWAVLFKRVSFITFHSDI